MATITTTQAIASGAQVVVDFGTDRKYAATVIGWQEGCIGLYELRWDEAVPRYMRKGQIDLIEQDRVTIR